MSSETMHIEASVGGIITVQNSRGDTVSLEIPPNALSQSLDITLTALSNPPPNPIATNIFPGVTIIPDGVILGTPATLKVSFAASIPDPELSYLFYLIQPDYVLPIYRIMTSSETLSGHISHLSTFIAGQPTIAEVNAQAIKAATSHTEPYTLQDIMDIVDAFETLGEMAAILPGGEAVANDVLGKAKQLLEDNIESFMRQIPTNPCGEYLLTLIHYGNMVDHFYTPDEFEIGLMTGAFQTELRIMQYRNEILGRCWKDPIEGTKWQCELTGINHHTDGKERYRIHMRGEFEIKRSAPDRALPLTLEGKAKIAIQWHTTWCLYAKRRVDRFNKRVVSVPAIGEREWNRDLSGGAGHGYVTIHVYMWIPPLPGDPEPYYTHHCKELATHVTNGHTYWVDLPHDHSLHHIPTVYIPPATYKPPETFPNDWVRKAVLQDWYRSKSFHVKMEDGTYTYDHDNWSTLAGIRDWYMRTSYVAEDLVLSYSLRLRRLT